MTFGILACGAYIPRLRLARRVIAEANSWINPSLKGQAKGERAICNWDEDAVTMAVAAGRDALAAHANEQFSFVVEGALTAEVGGKTFSYRGGAGRQI